MVKHNTSNINSPCSTHGESISNNNRYKLIGKLNVFQTLNVSSSLTIYNLLLFIYLFTNILTYLFTSLLTYLLSNLSK